MKITEVKCKTALSKSNLPGLDYSLNPYRGCQHSCVYCYVPNVLRIKREDWGGFVNVKTNIPVVLSKELRTKKPGVVAISTVTDPYQPVEKKYKLTRFCLEQLLIHDFPICLQTKSDLVLRDLDLISKFSNAEVIFSIATLDDGERRLMEPSSSPISNRLKAMKQFNNSGIKTIVFFGPIYPSIKIGNLDEIINQFIENGATEIIIDKLNLKPGILDNIIKTFPSYKQLVTDFSYDEDFVKKIKEICNKKNVKAIKAF